MLEIKISVISKVEMIAGVIVDTGEVEASKDKWVPFTRLRLGLIFLTIDFCWLKTS